MDKSTARRQILLGVLLLVSVMSVAGHIYQYYLLEQVREAWQDEGWRRGRAALFRLESARARAAQLDEQTRVLSNRAALVQSKLDEEIATHEPLRRQIERMMQDAIAQKASTIGNRDLLAEKTEEVAALQGRCLALTNEVVKLRRRYDSMTNEFATVQKTLQGVVAERTSLDTRLKEATETLAVATSSREALQAKLSGVEAELTSARAEMAKLKQTNEPPRSP